jgi:Flp pilus assembly protein TadG
MRYHCANRFTALLQRHVAEFRKRTEGVAAVEFALILPIMLTLLLGSIEISQAVTVDRRVTQVSTTTGDLVARADKDIASSEINDIMKVGAWLMKPYDDTSLKVTISVVTSSMTDANDRKTKWKCEFDGSNPNSVNCTCPNVAATIPNGLVGKGDSVVVAEVNFGYAPFLGFKEFLSKSKTMTNGKFTLSEIVYLKPRAACPQLTKADATKCGCT